MTLTEQTKTDEGRIELFVSVGAGEMADAAAGEYRKRKGSIVVQGFRKGKAPRPVIERMYGKTFFYEEALNGMVQKLCDFALEESGIDIIDQPRVTVSNLGVEDGASLVFSVLPRPQLMVRNYKGLKISKHIHPVEDTDVQREIDAMLEKNSRLITVEDRLAEIGDISVIDFEGFLEDKAFDGGKGESFSLTLGSGQFIPGFEDQIVGHSAGDEFDVNVTFPTDYGAEHLAGKDVVFKVKLCELRKKELPDADDEFAKDVSEFDTLAELKDDIKKRLEKDRDAEAEAGVENQAGDLLAEQLEGDVPAVMIESRIDELIRDFTYRMGTQGLDVNSYLKYVGQDAAAFREGFAANAEKQVRTRLALEAVVRAENLTVSDEEVEAEWSKMAENYQMDAEKIKEMLPVSDLKKDLAANKALDFVKNCAEVTEDVHSAHDHEHGHEHDDEAEE